MTDRWTGLSYYLFPSFENSFDRYAYEEYDDIDEDTEEETEEIECLD